MDCALLGGGDGGCIDWRGRMGSCYPGRGNSMDKVLGVRKHPVSGTQGYAYGHGFSLVRSPNVEVMVNEVAEEATAFHGVNCSSANLSSPPRQLSEFFHIHLPLQDTFHASSLWLRCLPMYSRVSLGLLLS